MSFLKSAIQLRSILPSSWRREAWGTAWGSAVLFHQHYTYHICVHGMLYFGSFSIDPNKSSKTFQYKSNLQTAINPMCLTTFHEQLLCQLIYTNLSGTLRGAFSIKVGHNFLLCVLVKLETVLLVKLWNFIASFPPNAVHRHICALCQKVGKIYPGQIKLLFSFCWKGQNVIASNTPRENSKFM